MKLLLFAMSLLSFVIYKADKLPVNPDGTLKGSYRSNDYSTNNNNEIGVDGSYPWNFFLVKKNLEYIPATIKYTTIHLSNSEK